MGDPIRWAEWRRQCPPGAELSNPEAGSQAYGFKHRHCPVKQSGPSHQKRSSETSEAEQNSI